MNNRFSIIILYALCTNIGNAKLYFDTTGYAIGACHPLLKDKHGVADLEEDSFATSPVALVICDGVGGSPFSSKYISNHLADTFQEIAFAAELDDTCEDLSKEIFFRDAISELHSAVQNYEYLVRDGYKAWLSDPAHKAPFTYDKLASSTTLIGAVIANSNEGPRLRVIQKGDSLAVVFRRFESKSRPGNFYFLPVYVTVEQQYSFNFPHQFSAFYKNEEKDVYKYEFEIQEGDYVLLGSDGLFDNMSLGLITMVFNFMAANSHESVDKINELVVAALEIYRWILNEKLWVLEEFYKRGKLYSIKDENNNRHKPQFTIGRSFFSFVHNKMQFFSVDNSVGKGEKDAFGEKLNAKLKADWKAGKMTAEQALSWRKYFECPVLKMMSIHEASGESVKHVKDCVREVLDKYVSFPEKVVHRFRTSKITPRVKASIIAKAAHYLATLIKSYPSPFALHAWKEGVSFDGGLSGKIDDITVVVSAVEEANYDPGETIHNLMDAYKEIKINTMKKMELDIFSFLNYYQARVETFMAKRKKGSKMNAVRLGTAAEPGQKNIKEESEIAEMIEDLNLNSAEVELELERELESADEMQTAVVSVKNEPIMRKSSEDIKVTDIKEDLSEITLVDVEPEDSYKNRELI